MKKKYYVIKYQSNSTVNGQPVGVVYASRCVGPAWPEDADVWSYTKTPEACGSKFSSAEKAQAEMHRWAWQGAEVVEVSV